MITHEFTKNEIAIYLRDFNKVIMYAGNNQNVSFYKIFEYHVATDGRVQYLSKDYYYEMISIYEILLASKILTIYYDNCFTYLLDSHINSLNIPEDIFVNKKDAHRFSKKQIIKYIRNAFNHNDNNDLLKFLRVYENNVEKIKVEILLKNTRPIPFHIILDVNQLIAIAFENQNANTFQFLFGYLTQPTSINSSNAIRTLDNVYLRKFYSRKKISDEQKRRLIKPIINGKKGKNIELVFLDNGMEYKDFHYFTDQKIKVEEDLKCWEKMGFKGNGVLEHVLNKVMPISILKIETITMNFILVEHYMKNWNSTFFDIVKDSIKVLKDKKCNKDSPFWDYVQLFKLDNNILYESLDVYNLISITTAIYFGYLFDTLVTDDDIIINDTKTIKREKIRNSFVHMRWFKGINECFKLFDWENGIDNELNPNSANFFRTNVR